CAKNDRHSSAMPSFQYRIKLTSKIPISPLPDWRVEPDLVLLEHAQPSPGLLPAPFRSNHFGQSLEELADLCGFRRQARPNNPQPRRLWAEHCSRAEGSNNFVVAHVDDPEIAIEFRALTSNRQNGVRVYRGHRGANNLKLSS